MITTTPTRLMAFAGAALLIAITLFIPLDALAQGIGSSTDLKTQASTISKQLVNIPKLIAMASYVIGAFFAVRCLFALKGFIEAPDDNPITKVLGYGAVAALLIMLPYILSVMASSIGAKNTTVQSSAGSFKDSGF